MKNKKHIFIPLIVLVSVCFVGLIISIICFKVINKDMNYSTKTIEFLYDGASDGKDPDGNEFNAADLLTEAVVTEGIKNAGMENRYKYEDVKSYLIIKNIVPDNVISEITAYTSLVKSGNATTTINSNKYNPTRFNIILYRDFDKKINKNDLNKLVDSITESYFNLFYKTYQKSFDSTNYSEIYSMDNYDYIYQVEVYENKLNALSKYAKALFDKNNTFTFKNKTFNDISLKATSLISNDVAKIRNSITYNALSKDVNRLKDYYNYKISSLNYDKTKYTTDLTNITTQINNYEKDSTVYIGSGENVIKVDSNSSETYNALLAKKISISETIAQINTDILRYTNILADIDAATATQDEYVRVEANIETLANEYDDLEASLNEMLTAYNDNYVNNGAVKGNETEYKNRTSLISTSFIVYTIKIELPLVGLTVIGICVYLLIREVRKNKKRDEVIVEAVAA